MKNLSICLIQVFFAVFAFGQEDTGLIVHEWGTFTAQYTHDSKPKLDVHKRVEEPVPDFVFRISTDSLDCVVTSKEYRWNQKIPIDFQEISIRMETPVIYFYSPKRIDNVSIAVNFKQGTINEIYPDPVEFEDDEYLKENLVYRHGFEYDFFKYGKLKMSLYNGKAKWKINILEPTSNLSYTEPENSVPEIWQTPRKTNANLIESYGQIEKYIFYRGLGGFDNGVVPFYTKAGNLILKNNTGKKIPFAIVYELDSMGNRYIWGFERNLMSEVQLNKNRNAISDKEWNNYLNLFIKELVRDGLYEDEATAMLNTWKHSYFEKLGLRIFWITPRKMTDLILPISISHPVQSLQRVMVGRTEIDPFNDTSSNFYKDDYKLKETYFTISPNPALNYLFIQSKSNMPLNSAIMIYDISGKLIKHDNIIVAPDFGFEYAVNDLKSGLYMVKLRHEGVENIFKIAIQN